MARKNKDLESWLAHTVNDRGEKIFTKKASEFTKAEVKKMKKLLNDRLYKLEKSGLAQFSNMYNKMLKYSEKKTSLLSNEDGKLRIKPTADGADNINEIRKYLVAKTSTVGGTNRALKKSYKTFVSRPSFNDKIKETLTMEKYKELWKIYRDNVSQDAKDKLGSDVVVDAIKSTNFYDLPEDKLVDVFKYANEVAILSADTSKMEDSTVKTEGMNQLYELWKKNELLGKL